MRRRLVFLLVALYIVSCNNNTQIEIEEEIDEIEEIFYLKCGEVSDDGNYFVGCEEMLDTTGLKLYNFVHLLMKNGGLCLMTIK